MGSLGHGAPGDGVAQVRSSPERQGGGEAARPEQKGARRRVLRVELTRDEGDERRIQRGCEATYSRRKGRKGQGAVGGTRWRRMRRGRPWQRRTGDGTYADEGGRGETGMRRALTRESRDGTLRARRAGMGRRLGALGVGLWRGRENGEVTRAVACKVLVAVAARKGEQRSGREQRGRCCGLGRKKRQRGSRAWLLRRK